jgi:hypothetical protein
MKNKKLVIASVILVMFLSGCKTIVTSNIYTEDVFSDENTEVPVEMKLEVSSCTGEHLEEAKTDVLALFSSTSNAAIAGCESEGFDSFLLISIVGTMASENAQSDVIIFRRSFTDSSEIGLAVVLSPNFLNRVNNLASSSMQTISHDDFEFIFNIHNDSGTEIEVYSDLGWLNGEASLDRTSVIKKRKILEYKTSDVISALILEQKQPVVLWVMPTSTE